MVPTKDVLAQAPPPSLQRILHDRFLFVAMWRNYQPNQYIMKTPIKFSVLRGGLFAAAAFGMLLFTGCSQEDVQAPADDQNLQLQDNQTQMYLQTAHSSHNTQNCSKWALMAMSSGILVNLKH